VLRSKLHLTKHSINFLNKILKAKCQRKTFFNQVLRNTLIKSWKYSLPLRYTFGLSIIDCTNYDGPKFPIKFVRACVNKIWLMIITPLFRWSQQVAARTNGRVFRQNPEEKTNWRLDSNNWRYVLDKMARSFTQGGNTNFQPNSVFTK
jgi:hypothetical protein